MRTSLATNASSRLIEYIGLPTLSAPGAPRPRMVAPYDYPIPAERAGTAIFIPVTNAIEALNFKLRRAIRARGHFPSDKAALGTGRRASGAAAAGATIPGRAANDCWQFDLSPSDLKQVPARLWVEAGRGPPTLMLFSAVDDRSGVAYQEYRCVYGEGL